MEFGHLKSFIKIAELGSFSKAAELLNSTQPTLGRQIRQMEIEVKQHLFIRHGRGVALTAAGQVLLEHGRGIIYQLERAMEELSMLRGALSGKVVLGIPPTPSRQYTLAIIKKCKEVMPEVTLSIVEQLSVGLTQYIVQGQIDLALVYNMHTSRDIEIQAIKQEPMVAVQKNHGQHHKSISIEQLAQEPLVLPSKPHAIRMLVESTFAKIGKGSKISIEVDSLPAILSLVADGYGTAVLPRQAVELHSDAYTDQFVLLDIHPTLYNQLGLATNCRLPSSAVIRKLTQIIIEMVN